MQNTIDNAPATRHITVLSKGTPRRTGIYAFFPQINLHGKWLEDIGFKSGHTLDITCENQKLTITLSKEQRFDDVDDEP